MALIIKCITCNNNAEHTLAYCKISDENNWLGNYCTKCFVKKLRGMALVHNNRLKNNIPKSEDGKA